MEIGRGLRSTFIDPHQSGKAVKLYPSDFRATEKILHKKTQNGDMSFYETEIIFF